MDTSDRTGVGGDEGKSAHVDKEIIEAGAVSSVDSPACSLEFHATLFGSTLAKVFTALDGVALGQQVAITTNDP